MRNSTSLFKRRHGFSLGVLTLLAACGGGVGELLLVAGFLGSGGGQYFLDNNSLPGFQSVDCGGQPCSVSITVDAPRDPNSGLPVFDLYATAYAVRVSGSVSGCVSATGRVQGRNVLLGDCIAGQYVNPNLIRSDDGRRELFHDFIPDLTTGVWVDVNNTDQRFKFTSGSAGCEITSSGKKPLRVTVTSSNYSEMVSGIPNTVLRPRTVITSLTVTNGASWNGDFIGASSMQLTGGGRSIEVERRNQAANCS